MNSVDLVVGLAVLAAAIHGLRLGALVQVLSFAGAATGLVLGALLAPHAAQLSGDPLLEAAASLGVVLAGVTLLAAAARRLGLRIVSPGRDRTLARLDAAVGAFIAGVSTLLVCWLLATLLATATVREAAAGVHGSRIVRALDEKLPPPPALFAQIQAHLDASGVPPVFAGLEPLPGAPLPTPADPEVRAALSAARASTARVIALGCGGVHSGSGYHAGGGLIVTNAHVVAGADSVSVQLRGNEFVASPVLFDPNLDLAVVRVENLRGDGLSLVPGDVERGARGSVVGHPDGGALTGEGAVVLRRFDAVGRDIYNRDLVRRPVYELQAKVRPGNSGGPVVTPDGTVIGVVFSRSAWNGGIGYALTSEVVAQAIDRAAERGSPVGTGSCV